MTKAWDVSELVSKFKSAGIPVLEDGALKIINASLDWVEESVKLSDNTIDDVALMAIPLVRKYATDLADKLAASIQAKADATPATVATDAPAATPVAAPVQALPQG